MLRRVLRVELTGSTPVNMSYGFTRAVDIPFEKAVERVTETLKDEGFGVLTSIDVKETLKKKLNVDFGKYVILGACNPPLAHRALQTEPTIGLLLPCNVIVYEHAGKTVVGAFDPMMMVGLAGKAELEPIAAEVKRRLQFAVDAV